VILELCKGVHYVDLGESFEMHTSIYSYLLAKFGFDPAQNEPFSVCCIPRRELPHPLGGVAAAPVARGRNDSYLAFASPNQFLPTSIWHIFGRI